MKQVLFFKSMKQVLFFIGCILFFWSLFAFVIWTLGAMIFTKNLGFSPAKDINVNVYFHTVIFFVGTYLISNNKPEDK
jgi:hypothetical protein